MGVVVVEDGKVKNQRRLHVLDLGNHMGSGPTHRERLHMEIRRGEDEYDLQILR
jgi:hypothetical protein